MWINLCIALVGAVLYLFIRKATHNYVVPRLPVLTPFNKTTYPEWHSYYERVYGCEVNHEVDLNTFTFFFWWSPMGFKKVRVCTWQRTKLSPNEAWIGDHGPDLMLARVGFFVHRPDSPFTQERHVEVIRVNTNKLVVNEEFQEKDVAWYFGVKGSGMFLSVPEVGVSVFKNKYAFAESVGTKWPNSHLTLKWEQTVLPNVLKDNKIKMLILTHSGHPTPRQEVVVPIEGLIETCPNVTLWRFNSEGQLSPCECQMTSTVLNCLGNIKTWDHPPCFSLLKWKYLSAQSESYSRAWRAVQQLYTSCIAFLGSQAG